MLIGIEAERANNPLKTGVEHYAKELILHLSEIDSENQYILYLRTEPQEWFKKLPNNFKIKILRSPFPYLWTQMRLNWELIKCPVDVLFVPSAAVPLLRPSRTVTTIHDLIWKYYPETYTIFDRLYLRFTNWYAVRFCKKIITVSNSTKNDLLKFYKIDPRKIKVTHLGYELAATADQPDSKTQHLKPYILFLGTLQPRKNIVKLIQAVDLLRKKYPNSKINLVIAGKKGWMYQPILDAIGKHKDFVTYLGYVSGKDRDSLLKGAQALVIPSLYEGFGMQVLDGFAANIPVAVSNVSSLPEVAGQAAVYFNPRDISDMADKIHMIVSDKNLTQNLTEEGRRRLANFSWNKCAQATLEVLQ